VKKKIIIDPLTNKATNAIEIKPIAGLHVPLPVPIKVVPIVQPDLSSHKTIQNLSKAETIKVVDANKEILEEIKSLESYLVHKDNLLVASYNKNNELYEKIVQLEKNNLLLTLECTELKKDKIILGEKVLHKTEKIEQLKKELVDHHQAAELELDISEINHHHITHSELIEGSQELSNNAPANIIDESIVLEILGHNTETI
jgi:hypothetical protein